MEALIAWVSRILIVLRTFLLKNLKYDVIIENLFSLVEHYARPRGPG